jgi:hypothetical protein
MNSPAARFCLGTPEQLATLRERNIDTVGDILTQARDHAIALYDSAPTPDPRLEGHVYKRAVMDFLKMRCRSLYFDVHRLERETNLRTGGEYPWQWIGFPARRRKPHVETAVAQPRNLPPAPIVYVDDEAALAPRLLRVRCFFCQKMSASLCRLYRKKHKRK